MEKSEGATLLGPEGQGTPDKKATDQHAELGWWSAAAFQATWSTSSSTVIVPFTFAQLGYVFGPIWMVIFISLAFFLEARIIKVAGMNGCKSIGDVGQLLGGAQGRWMLTTFQILNNLFFMPTALVFCAHSLRNVLNPLGLNCNLFWTSIVVFAAFFAVQIGRTFSHAAVLAFFTTGMCVIQVCFICISCVSHQEPTVSTGNYTYKVASASHQPSDGEGFAGWATWFGAIGSVSYIYAPCYITVEVMAEMNRPSEMYHSLVVSTCFIIGVYLLVGLTPVLWWGWDLQGEITNMLDHGFMGRAANLLLLVASGYDYLLASFPVNALVQRTVAPDFNMEDYSASGCLKWAVISAASFLLSLALATMMPRLQTLVGLISSLCIPTSQLIIPSVLLLWGNKKHAVLEDDIVDEVKLLEQSNALTVDRIIDESVMYGVALCVGIVMVISATTATIYNIANTSYEGDFFCTLSG